MPSPMNKAEQYVSQKHALDALWEEMDGEERTEAQIGLKWLGLVGNGQAKRGRPFGSKNKQKEGEVVGENSESK